ncbi:MAG: peroxiredoxin family protein [Anaerolineae bacterium]|nr:peroxiredoxin family protein [Anaerolineae bacterium]
MPLITPGTPAPMFKSMNLTGPEIDLEKYKGQKPVVLMFSSTRVDPAQIAAVRDLWKKYREKIEIITVSFKLPSVSMAKTFMQQMGAKFPATYDPAQNIYKMYGIENPVAIVVIDRNGNVAYAAEGLDTKDTKALENAIIEYAK